MIRFVRIFNTIGETDRVRIAQVQEIFRRVFIHMPDYADRIPKLLDKRSQLGYEVILLVAEQEQNRVAGFTLSFFFPAMRYAFLDFIATKPENRQLGLGGALYEATREYLLKKKARGLFFDVPSDDPKKVTNPEEEIEVNKRRLRFYERFGAFPIINTLYDVPPDEERLYDKPLLVFDPLGQKRKLGRSEARKMVREILVRKYDKYPKDQEVRRVVLSFQDDPVQLREPQYWKIEQPSLPTAAHVNPLKLVVSKHHEIHHVQAVGYVERPARVPAIMRGLAQVPHEELPAEPVADEYILRVHEQEYLDYLKAVIQTLKPGQVIYPNVFPVRQKDRKPEKLDILAGYYTIDNFTPVSREAYTAARAAVDCAVTAAHLLLEGERMAYALCRPPGHHAEPAYFGGFCYFNNAAIAADMLAEKGKTVLLDIDFHHGNGAQEMFYSRSDVFTISIHGDPRYHYPYFAGFADETGAREGEGYNLNLPLQQNCGEEKYLEALEKALHAIKEYDPQWLVLGLGWDIMRGDPTGSFMLSPRAMGRVGRQIGQLQLSTLIIQEGGYSIWNLNQGARQFFPGLLEGWF